MTYLMVYRSGATPLTSEQLSESRHAWQAWNKALNETYGMRATRGKVVSAQGVEDSDGRCRGASMVEAGSLDEAIEVARKSPTVFYGSTVEVLEEYQRSDG